MIWWLDKIFRRIGLERSPLSRRVGFKPTIHSGPVCFSTYTWSHQYAYELTACLHSRCENGSKINRSWTLREKCCGKWKQSCCKRDGKSHLHEVRSFQMFTDRIGQGKHILRTWFILRRSSVPGQRLQMSSAVVIFISLSWRLINLLLDIPVAVAWFSNVGTGRKLPYTAIPQKLNSC